MKTVREFVMESAAAMAEQGIAIRELTLPPDTFAELVKEIRPLLRVVGAEPRPPEYVDVETAVGRVRVRTEVRT